MNGSQRRNFEAVLAGLQRIGFRGDLLRPDYKFHDWFQPDRPVRRADAATFGQTPVSYDNACFVVLIANGRSGPELISQYRSLGAPRAFEIRDDQILHWKVTTSPSERDVQETFEPQAVKAAIISHKDDWNPQSVLRAKNIAAPGPRQLDFIDLGLIPALEQHIRDKLGPLLQKIFHAAKNEYKRRLRVAPPWDELCRLVFRVLAGKIMVDRAVHGFRSFSGVPDADDLLASVEHHYQDSKPVTDDPYVRSLVVREMWENVSFENLSVEVLADIWENTLVSDEVRKRLSIHATPPNVARYVVNHLPIETIPQEDRRVVEPCCGSGTFLVAALQRLRELLPSDMDGQQRHEYFVQRLAGFDIETFGLEVARSSLMLADFPNPNGWVLEREDVFESPQKTPKFTESLSAARVVLCNPPFGDFDEGERQRYKWQSVHKPVDLLLRVLRSIGRNGVLGFVLPRVVLDGRGYRGARETIAERFEEVELVSLPDRVFEHAQHETVLLLGCQPRRSSPCVCLNHRKVADADTSAFLTRYEATREDRAQRVKAEIARSIAVPDLQEMWKYLSECLTLGDIAAQIHRGIEWNIPLYRKGIASGKKEIIPENARLLISDEPRPGFKRGIRSAQGMKCFQTPPICYVCTMPKYRRINKVYGLPWDQPKAIVNKNRLSRGPWRIAAFADHSGLVYYQSFIAIWPRSGWSATSIAAILNSPVANAFIASQLPERNIKRETLKRIPMPVLGATEQERIQSLMDDYTRRESSLHPCEENIVISRGILRQIDALVLKGYRLPPRLERQLLDYFRGHKRPIPFDFGDYYPADFKPYIPLWMYDSEKFRNSTAQRFLEGFPKINDPDVLEVLADL